MSYAPFCIILYSFMKVTNDQGRNISKMLMKEWLKLFSLQGKKWTTVNTHKKETIEVLDKKMGNLEV